MPSHFELADGAAVTVREVHESDEIALRTWYASLSHASLYHRFHGHVSELSPAHWRYLTHVDGVDHVALLAVLEHQVVGIARMIRLDELDAAAELTFLVDDAFQRRGIGSLLRDILLVLATRRGYRALHAYVLPDNVGIRRLLAGTAPRVIDKRDVIELEL